MLEHRELHCIYTLEALYQKNKSTKGKQNEYTGTIMEYVNITQDMRDYAEQEALRMGKLNNSILSGKGNTAGFIGELVAHQIFGGTIANTYDYDLILTNGLTVDVKTKRVTSAPRPHYECSVAAFNTKQQCDAYAFVRVDSKCKKAWFLGAMGKQEYFDAARFMKKGDVDPSNNFIVKADCYNLPLARLDIQ